jgi:hypothetical protein
MEATEFTPMPLAFPIDLAAKRDSLPHSFPARAYDF